MSLQGDVLSGDGYPEYRRRGRVVAQKNGQQIDDRWVVPYNPYLLETFDCHINCEVAAHKRLNVGRLKIVCALLYFTEPN